MVLSAANDYFYDELIKKANKTGKLCIQIDDKVDNSSISTLIEYCYTGNIIITGENVENLLYTANAYGFIFAKTKCIDYLVSLVDRLDKLLIWRLADLYGSKRLQNAVMEKTADKFLDLVKSDAYQKLNSNDVSMLLQRDDILVASEEEIFDAIVKWIEHDVNSRKNDFGKLLQTVRMAGISNEVK